MINQQPSVRGNQIEFDELYREEAEPKTIRSVLTRQFHKVCVRTWLLGCVKRHCQIWRTLTSYTLVQDFPCDILAGISVGIMHIPQSMAYSLLATLPPISGLYTALFAPIVYLFLGTSKHLSMGAITVVSLMMAAVLDKQLTGDGELATGLTANSTQLSNQSSLEYKKLEIAVALSFVSGLIMAILGKLGLGIITTYMSEPLISAFTSGVAVHVLVSQLKNILGLKIRRNNGVFKIFKTLVEVFGNIGLTNFADLLTSVVCMLVLYIVKAQINDRFKKYLPIPIPIELFVIILSTVLSYFFHFESTFGVDVVGHIPAGLPSPRLPDFSIVKDVLPDAFLIGVVAFGQSVSMAKILARRHKYTINPNQEMVAYGAGSMLCAVFTGYVTAGSVARSLVQESAGGRTQIASIFSCIVVFVVIMAVGPLFYALPQSVLASVILVAIRSMFLQVRETKTLWRTCKYDLMVWLVTYSSVVILDADIGLAIGIAFSILTVVIRTQRTKPALIERVGDTNNYRPVQLYKDINDTSGVKIFTFNSPLYFANVDHFLAGVSKCLDIDLEKGMKEKKGSGCNPCPERSFAPRLRSSLPEDNLAFIKQSVPRDLDKYVVPETGKISDDLETIGSINSAAVSISSGNSGDVACGDLDSATVLQGVVDNVPEDDIKSTCTTIPQSFSSDVSSINPPTFSRLNRGFSLTGQHPVALQTEHPGLAFGLINPPPYWNLRTSPSAASLSSSDTSYSVIKIRYVIFDMSRVNFIDSVGVKILQQLVEDCNSLDIYVLLSSCNDDVCRVLKSFESWDNMAPRLYLSIEDAIAAVTETNLTNNFTTDSFPVDPEVNPMSHRTYL